MQSITLDLIPQEVKPILKVSQYDDNWDVKIFITENGEALAVSPSDTATLIIRKPDGNIVTLEAEAAYADAFKVTLTEQACACYGDSFGELVIEANTGGVTRRKGTCNFILSVEISPEFGGIVSASSIHNLRTQINQMTAAAVAVVAPPIIAELVPSIVGDQYLTKAQIEAGYYSKTQVDNLLTQLAATIPHKITGVLPAGSTSITLTDTATVNALSDNSLVSIFTSVYGVNPTAAVVDGTNHTITLTFEEQQTALNIAVTIL